MTEWTWITKKSNEYGYEYTVYANGKLIKTDKGYGSSGVADAAARDFVELQIEEQRIIAIKTK